MKPKIWLSSPHMSGKEMKYIQEAFDSNWVAPLGPNVAGFEQELCEYTGAKACSCLVSGTAAIHLSLILADVEKGDEVICSSFTFSASANPIVYLGATPVFVDSEEETWNMDPILLEEAIKDRQAKGKKIKAVILVHLYGMPAKIDEILSICQKYDIPLIEDAAEALGSKYKGKQLGTFGKMGVLSFNGNKIITCSGGGALISNEPDLCRKATFLATQARDPAPYYQHSVIGYNYRMSNILAGIGRGQLQVIYERVNQRRNNFIFYKELFEDFPGVQFLEEPSEDFFSNHWLTTVVINRSLTGFDNEELRSAFEKENIESRPLWKPMHLQPIFKDCPAYINGVSEKLFNDGLCLPSGSNITEEDKERIRMCMLSVMQK